MLVQLRDIHLSFPDKTVLGGVSLAVHRGDRMALVGENGAGKTCLFRIVLGRIIPDAGQVLIAAGTRTGYLEQTPLDAVQGTGARTCLEVALEPFSGVRALERRIEQITAALARAGGQEETARLLEALGETQPRFEEGGGYTYRSRTSATLAGLGLPEPIWGQPVGKLSAGQKVRLALARLLLEEHDLLLLDEPTNHLDLAARKWLEEYLAHLQVAYVVASHDRRFLDRVATRVAHLERGILTLYAGSYSAFRDQAARNLETTWLMIATLLRPWRPRCWSSGREPMIDTGLRGKVVLVTGANHSIAATGKAFAAQGVACFINYLGGPSPEPVIQAIRGVAGRVGAWEADLADPTTIPMLFNRVEAVLGPVDILVNNAATSEGDTFIPPGPLALDWADRPVSNIVSPGPIQTGWITPEIEEREISRIPLGRIGQPEDVADVVVFLTSQQARWLTGQTLFVGGGHRMI